MVKVLIYRCMWLGFFSWLIPFGVSYFCYTKEGHLVMDYSLFKSIMFLSGTMSVSYLLYQYFKLVISHFILNGLIVGFTWLVINILLDSMILIPIMKLSFSTYFLSIGLSYFSIPIISIAMGYLLDIKAKTD